MTLYEAYENINWREIGDSQNTALVKKIFGDIQTFSDWTEVYKDGGYYDGYKFIPDKNGVYHFYYKNTPDGQIFGSSDIYTKHKGEYIIGAAIKHPENGDIFIADNHEDAEFLASMRDDFVEGGKQGFFTSTNRFVDRKEALEIAKRCKQLKTKPHQPEHGVTASEITGYFD